MATFSEALEFEVSLDAAGFRKGIESMSKQAEKTASGVGDAFRKSGQTIEDSAKRASKNASKSFDAFADSAGDSERALLGVADLLDLVDPRAGAVARGIADIGGATEGIIKAGPGIATFGTALAGLGAVVGSVFLAYKAFTEETERNTRVAQINADLYRNTVLPLMEQIRDARIDTKEATGELSEEEANQLRRGAQLYADYGNAVEDQAAKIAELREQQGSLITHFADQYEEIGRTIPRFRLIAALVGGVTKSTADLEAEIAGLTEGMDPVINKTADLADELAKAEEAQRQKAAEDRAAQEALREEARRVSEAEAAYRSYTAQKEAAEAQLANITAGAQDAILEGEEAIIRARDRQIIQITELIEKGADGEQAALAMAAVSEKAAHDLAEFHEEAAQAAQEAHDRSLEGLTDGLDQVVAEYDAMLSEVRSAQLSSAADIAGATSDIFGVAVDVFQSTIDSQRAAFESLTKTEREQERDAFIAAQQERKEAALNLFKFEKAAGISEATINGAIAITSALKNPLLAPFLIPAIVATTAAQIATIAAQPAPTFHQGGMIQATGQTIGNVPIVARDGEAVLTRQGVNAIGGPEAVTAANRGSGMESRSIRAEFVVGPRTSGDQYLQAVGANGTMRRATAALRPSGRTNPYR